MKLSSGTKCRCTLGELIECFDNKRIPLSAQERATRKGPYRYYGAQNVVDHIDAYLFDGEYALIAEDGENLRSQKQDVAQIVEGQFWVNNHAHIIQANANADLWYLCALLNQTDISRYISGSAQPKLSQEGMRKIVVEVPDVQEQRRIGLLLRCLDRKIALNRKKIATLEKMAKEIYDYWFVQYDFPDANGRPYKSSGGEMVYSPELKREIPKGWRVGVARDLISEIRTGLNPRDNFKFSGTIKYLTVKNLTTSGAIDFKGCDTIDDYARMIVHKRSDIRKDDILFASIEPLGRCALLQSDPEDFDINESIFSIRYQSSTCQPEFLYYLLRSESFVARCSLASAGSVFKGIRINDLYNIAVQLPARNVIERFSSRVSCVLKQIYNVENSMRQLSTLRDFLLPLLMNGQVKVG